MLNGCAKRTSYLHQQLYHSQVSTIYHISPFPDNLETAERLLNTIFQFITQIILLRFLAWDSIFEEFIMTQMINVFLWLLLLFVIILFDHLFLLWKFISPVKLCSNSCLMISSMVQNFRFSTLMGCLKTFESRLHHSVLSPNCMQSNLRFFWGSFPYDIGLSYVHLILFPLDRDTALRLFILYDLR